MVNGGAQVVKLLDREVPKQLYKYRSFSARTTQSLLSDEIFWAPPESFKGTLDTKPSLHTDLDMKNLRKSLSA